MTATTERNPRQDKRSLIDHCNIMGRVASQTQLGPDLWQVDLHLPPLFVRLAGCPKELTFFFDKQIGFVKDRQPTRYDGFNIVIRHAFECVDGDGVIYYVIAAGSIMENGAAQGFKAAMYEGQ